MKRVLAFILAAVMMFSAGIYVGATESQIMPRWVTTNDANINMRCTGTSGSAQATIMAKSGTTKISATMTVYVLEDGEWEYVDSNFDTSTSTYCSFSVSFTAERGKQYKAELNAYVTCNGVEENVTATGYATCPTNN